MTDPALSPEGRAPLTAHQRRRKRATLARKLRKALGADSVISDDVGLAPFAQDGLTTRRTTPLVAILPYDADATAQAIALCREEDTPITPRGAGTSLSGGAQPLADGATLSLARLNRILEIDADNLCARVQPGVVNAALSRATREHGLYFAPDPSSQVACTLGGNVAENAGGIHSLKYGVTASNLLGLEAILINGERLSLGGDGMEAALPNLLGLLTGSEGLLAAIVEARVRLTPLPERALTTLAGFATEEACAEAVAAVIGAGVIPAGMEMMDALAVAAVEAFMAVGYPRDAAATLIIEVDGPAAEAEAEHAVIAEVMRAAGATSLTQARTEAARARMWAGRKAAFAAMGRASSDYLCMDGSIPRGALAEVLTGIRAIGARFGLRVANVFHAGDGNLHPLILFDQAVAGETARAEACGAEILRLCLSVGGALTGEHGVGLEKRALMDEAFAPHELDQQQRVKCAFDADSLFNPGKVFPRLRRCAELGQVHVHGGRLAHPDVPRF